jgi:hypothetical protein
MIDAVPDDVHCWNGRILVSCLTGFPFLARFAQVVEVDAATGVAKPFISDLTLPIGIAASSDSSDASLFALEYSSGSFGSAGQLVRFREPNGPRLTLTGSIGNPTGLVFDAKRGLIWIADNRGGRVLRLQTR